MDIRGTEGAAFVSLPGLLILFTLFLLNLIQNEITEFIIVHQTHRADNHVVSRFLTFSQMTTTVVSLKKS